MLKGHRFETKRVLIHIKIYVTYISYILCILYILFNTKLSNHGANLPRYDRPRENSTFTLLLLRLNEGELLWIIWITMKNVSTLSTTLSTRKYSTSMTFPNISIAIESSFLPSSNVCIHLVYLQEGDIFIFESLCPFYNIGTVKNKKACINIRIFLLQLILKVYI